MTTCTEDNSSIDQEAMKNEKETGLINPGKTKVNKDLLAILPHRSLHYHVKIPREIIDKDFIDKLILFVTFPKHPTTGVSTLTKTQRDMLSMLKFVFKYNGLLKAFEEDLACLKTKNKKKKKIKEE